MPNTLDRLRSYFENTPKEQIQSDWAKSENFDNRVSPSVNYFIESHIHYHIIEHDNLEILQQSFFNNLESPNFSSDFFLKQNYGEGKFCNRTLQV